MTAAPSMSNLAAPACLARVIRLRPPRLADLPEITATLAAQAAGHDLDGSFPAGGISQVHEAGLLTATVARRHGGAGAGLATTVSILRALGHGDPSVALITAMTLFTHAMQASGPTWPRRIYEEVLEESAARPVLINALRVEPELGTPARGGLPATVARWHSGTWLLSGRKTFSTGAEGLRWMVVWARTDEDPARVGSFLVRADSAGISIERTWDHLGLRASRSDDVIFTDTPVPPGATAGLHDPELPGPASPASRGRRVPGLELARAGRDLPGRGRGGPRLAGRLPRRADPQRARQAAGHAAPVPGRGRGDRDRAGRGG